MQQPEAHTMTKTIAGLVLAGLSIIALVLVAILAPEHLQTLIAILAPLIAGGVGLAAYGPSMGDRRGFSRLRLLIVCGLVGLAGLAACSTLAVTAKKTTHIEMWRTGCRVTVDVDGERVFTLDSEPGVQCNMPRVVNP